MKKKITVILVVAMLLACAVFGIAGANNDEKVTVVFNGEEVIFDETAPPVWKNHQLMVEMETIMDLLWSSAKLQSTGIIQCMRDLDKMSMMLDNDVVTVKNQIVKMEAVPFKIEGTDVVMVPLQFVVEAYGGTYSWDASTNTASVEIAAAQQKPMKFFDYIVMPWDDPATEGTIDGLTVNKDGQQTSYGAYKDCAIDGDYNTRWSASNKGAAEGGDEANYIILDFGQVTQVSGVGLAWYYGNGRDYSFAVEVSTDGENWIEVMAKRTNLRMDSIESFGWDDLDVVDAQYVKVVCYGDTTKYWTHITELRAYCPEGAPGALPNDLE